MLKMANEAPAEGLESQSTNFKREPIEQTGRWQATVMRTIKSNLTTLDASVASTFAIRISMMIKSGELDLREIRNQNAPEAVDIILEELTVTNKDDHYIFITSLNVVFATISATRHPTLNHFKTALATALLASLDKIKENETTAFLFEEDNIPASAIENVEEGASDIATDLRPELASTLTSVENLPGYQILIAAISAMRPANSHGSILTEGSLRRILESVQSTMKASPKLNIVNETTLALVLELTRLNGGEPESYGACNTVNDRENLIKQLLAKIVNPSAGSTIQRTHPAPTTSTRTASEDDFDGTTPPRNKPPAFNGHDDDEVANDATLIFSEQALSGWTDPVVPPATGQEETWVDESDDTPTLTAKADASPNEATEEELDLDDEEPISALQRRFNQDDGGDDDERTIITHPPELQ